MKTMLKLAGALVVLVMIGGVVTLQSAIKDARAEQQELSKAGAPTESKEAGRPAGVNDEVLRLREANKDLPKLRNEVRQLRRQADEMAKLQADNEQLKNLPKSGRQYPPDFVRRGALIDAGQATPEATIQTFFWAMTQGNISRLKDCLSPEDAANLLKQQTDQKIGEELAREGKAIPGFRIAGKRDISPDEVEIKVEVMPGTDGDIGPDGTESPIKLKRVGNEWKMEMGGL